MRKEIELEKAKKAAEMRKNGSSTAEITKALKITYAEYKKLEAMNNDAKNPEQSTKKPNVIYRLVESKDNSEASLTKFVKKELYRYGNSQ